MSLNQNSFISLVKYPILTEKTIQLLQSNQYSFAVDKKANKVSIKAAIEELFDVKVVSVNTSSMILIVMFVLHFYVMKTGQKDIFYVLVL